MKKTSLKGLKVGVIGLAKSGIAAANLARSKGASVLVSEIKTRERCKRDLAKLGRGIEVEFGEHSDRLLECDIIIKSPGVHGIDILKQAARKNIPVWGEIELAARYIGPRRIIAVTGTNGKTTTTDLTGAIFKASGEKTVVGGNIGSPLASLAGLIDRRTNVVLEMSSYQLEDSPSFHPGICAILNVTPDHMEHHHTLANYVNAKARIFARQTKKDTCILNHDDPVCRKLAARCPSRVIFFSRKKELPDGVFTRGDAVVIRRRGLEETLALKLRIPGMHNVENVLAAVAMASAAGIDAGIIEATVNRYRGVEHRIEFTADIAGVRYFNDSKGTNVDSTRVALESFSQPVWLILGGRDKGSSYAPLKSLIRRKVRGILLIGEAAAKIKGALAGTARFYDSGTLDQALRDASRLASPGDVVLLSPACASFDQFRDYEDRGRQFKKLVRSISR